MTSDETASVATSDSDSADAAVAANSNLPTQMQQLSLHRARFLPHKEFKKLLSSLPSALILEILDFQQEHYLLRPTYTNAVASISLQGLFGRFSNNTSERKFVLVTRNIMIYLGHFEQLCRQSAAYLRRSLACILRQTRSLALHLNTSSYESLKIVSNLCAKDQVRRSLRSVALELVYFHRLKPDELLLLEPLEPFITRINEYSANSAFKVFCDCLPKLKHVVLYCASASDLSFVPTEKLTSLTLAEHDPMYAPFDEFNHSQALESGYPSIREFRLDIGRSQEYVDEYLSGLPQLLLDTLPASLGGNLKHMHLCIWPEAEFVLQFIRGASIVTSLLLNSDFPKNKEWLDVLPTLSGLRDLEIHLGYNSNRITPDASVLQAVGVLNKRGQLRSLRLQCYEFTFELRHLETMGISCHHHDGEKQCCALETLVLKKITQNYSKPAKVYGKDCLNAILQGCESLRHLVLQPCSKDTQDAANEAVEAGQILVFGNLSSL